MLSREIGEVSFLVQETSSRLQKSPLIRMSGLIDWERLRKKMGGLGRSGYGPKGYDPLKMLKALILQG